MRGVKGRQLPYRRDFGIAPFAITDQRAIIHFPIHDFVFLEIGVHVIIIETVFGVIEQSGVISRAFFVGVDDEVFVFFHEIERGTHRLSDSVKAFEELVLGEIFVQGQACELVCTRPVHALLCARETKIGVEGHVDIVIGEKIERLGIKTVLDAVRFIDASRRYERTPIFKKLRHIRPAFDSPLGFEHRRNGRKRAFNLV